MKSRMLKVLMSNFYCTCCGKRGIPIMRRDGQGREPGHLKNLYCPYCKQERNCVEIRPNNGRYTVEDFFIEFSNGNFDEDGNRIQPMKRFLSTHKRGM